VSTRRTVVPPDLAAVYEQWHFAPAVVAGGTIFCSGIIGTSPGGEPPAPATAGGEDGALRGAAATLAGGAAPLAALAAVRDPEAQFATAFAALREVLRHAGADLADIVELTSYHVDISRHIETFMTVKDRYLTEPYPAWTAIGVSELVVPGGLVEIRAIAVAPDGGATPGPG
jgi:enamine deaminase RidA (YjgF/YER057c/UK114 family)